MGGVVLCFVGGALLLWTLGMVASVAVVWPVLLIAAGLWLLAGRLGRAARPGAHELEVSAIVDDRTGIVVDGPFTGGSLTAVLGDIGVDLRGSTLTADAATLDVLTLFGDVEITIPDGWQVTATGPELFGDVVLRGAGEPPLGAPVLRLRVFTVIRRPDRAQRAGTPATLHSPRRIPAGRRPLSRPSVRGQRRGPDRGA